ncbi:unnamed protein product [Didymodactylos carnosus]|uniref:Uncharacterized protein n=1 Tax=Didymodactylos carnosus TaxID=1234261 RepID=A0A813WMB6_9BILA|nr:unnamed protein product [Didymodactylos carnosus]CAF1257769.1 unnamed protein product [Didymodactylos carnosus]CAF3643546.1 unnamed protein product [Didymodactylos carnosus]CAF4064654.1 unnamed protein product [Didymodactylos carnosus]
MLARIHFCSFCRAQPPIMISTLPETVEEHELQKKITEEDKTTAAPSPPTERFQFSVYINQFIVHNYVDGEQTSYEEIGQMVSNKDDSAPLCVRFCTIIAGIILSASIAINLSVFKSVFIPICRYLI